MGQLIDYKLDTDEQLIRYYKKIKSELELKILKEPKRAKFYSEELNKVKEVINGKT